MKKFRKKLKNSLGVNVNPAMVGSKASAPSMKKRKRKRYYKVPKKKRSPSL